MTAKEKAEELFNKFEDDLMECDTYFMEEAQKRCALIAVDEIIKALRNDLPEIGFGKGYWYSVKKEIEKL